MLHWAASSTTVQSFRHTRQSHHHSLIFDECLSAIIAHASHFVTSHCTSVCKCTIIRTARMNKIDWRVRVHFMLILFARANRHTHTPTNTMSDVRDHRSCCSHSAPHPKPNNHTGCIIQYYPDKLQTLCLSHHLLTHAHIAHIAHCTMHNIESFIHPWTRGVECLEPNWQHEQPWAMSNSVTVPKIVYSLDICNNGCDAYKQHSVERRTTTQHT